MKVTFMEEIEAKHAWRESMYCPKCDCGNYRIHEQLQPEVKDPWWIDCPNCGYEVVTNFRLQPEFFGPEIN